MRLRDLLEDDTTGGSLKDVIGDVITYIKANGMSKISLKQFVELLKNTPEIQGIHLDPGQTLNVLRQFPDIKSIEKDLDTGNFVVNIKNPTDTSTLVKGNTDPEKEKEKVSKMAQSTLKKKFK